MKAAGKKVVGILVAVFGILLAAALLTVMIPAWVIADRLLKPPVPAAAAAPDTEGLEYETVRFRSMDNRVVEGWIIPCRRTRPLWIILSPGFRSGRAVWPDGQGLSLIRRLNEHRFSVLALEYNRFPDTRDLLGAVRYLKELDPSAEIGVLGWAEGGSTALCAAAQSDRILYVVADSPYADQKNYLSQRLPAWSRLPRNPWTPAALWIYRFRNGIDWNGASPFEAVKSLKIPVLILVTDKNPVISTDEGFLLEEVSSTVRVRQLPLAAHTRGYAEYPETWMLEVTGFIQGLGYY
jgi:hypothetical protein